MIGLPAWGGSCAWASCFLKHLSPAGQYFQHFPIPTVGTMPLTFFSLQFQLFLVSVRALGLGWGSPISISRSGLRRVCPNFCWDKVFISVFCVIWFGIINKRPLNWVAKLRQIMVSVQFSQQTELTSNAHCSIRSIVGERARGTNTV